ncbi:MAG: hypothetical protein AAF830_08455 [Pseudomonadota bacterium]
MTTIASLGISRGNSALTLLRSTTTPRPANVSANPAGISAETRPQVPGISTAVGTIRAILDETTRGLPAEKPLSAEVATNESGAGLVTQTTDKVADKAPAFTVEDTSNTPLPTYTKPAAEGAGTPVSAEGSDLGKALEERGQLGASSTNAPTAGGLTSETEGNPAFLDRTDAGRAEGSDLGGALEERAQRDASVASGLTAETEGKPAYRDISTEGRAEGSDLGKALEERNQRLDVRGWTNQSAELRAALTGEARAEKLAYRTSVDIKA